MQTHATAPAPASAAVGRLHMAGAGAHSIVCAGSQVANETSALQRLSWQCCSGVLLYRLTIMGDLEAEEQLQRQLRGLVVPIASSLRKAWIGFQCCCTFGMHIYVKTYTHAFVLHCLCACAAFEYLSLALIVSLSPKLCFQKTVLNLNIHQHRC